MRMMRMFGHAALGLVVAAADGGGAGCAPRIPSPIGTVGSPSANLWPLFIGIDKGFFAAQNIKVDLVYIPVERVGHPAALGRLARHVDVDRAGRSDPRHRPRRGDRASRASKCRRRPMRLLAKSSIKSLKDLKGKVISVGGPKDITRLYVERMLAPQGLKTGDYDYVYAGATTARAQALLGGAVDAAILLPPSNFQVQNAGFNDLGLDHRICAGTGVLGHGREQGVGRAQSRTCSSACSPPRARAPTIFYDPQNRAEAIQLLVRSAARSSKTSRRPTTSSARTTSSIAPARFLGSR